MPNPTRAPTIIDANSTQIFDHPTMSQTELGGCRGQGDVP